MGKDKNKGNREYKNSVFVDLFSLDEKTREDAVISFYNALHQEKITKKEGIKFIRLENVLFRKVRNDVSFVLDDKLVLLLEHQSTINPNMPVRFLDYIVGLYQLQIEPRLKLSQRKVSLPEPEFYVIYNGKASYPARKELRISDLFKSNKNKTPQLELIVQVININDPDNKDFLESCSLLNGYKKFIEKVEKYKALYGDKGYIMAIEECIKEGMEISEYLKRKMKEVVEMLTAEHSYTLELEASREDGRIEGIREGSINTAKRMKKASCEASFIMEMTGLSKQEIEKL